MLQSTINLIRQKTATKEYFMAMSEEERGNLYLDLLDTAEHLMDDDDVAYCEKLLVVLENFERIQHLMKEEPEAMKTVSVTAHRHTTQCGELSVPKDLTGEELREYIRSHWNEIPFGEPKLGYTDTDFEIDDEPELEEVEERE